MDWRVKGYWWVKERPPAVRLGAFDGGWGLATCRHGASLMSQAQAVALASLAVGLRPSVQARTAVDWAASRGGHAKNPATRIRTRPKPSPNLKARRVGPIMVAAAHTIGNAAWSLRRECDTLDIASRLRSQHLGDAG